MSDIKMTDSGVTPLSPAEALNNKSKALPEYVLRAVNDLLTKHITSLNPGSSIRFTTDDLIDLSIKWATSLGYSVTRQDLYDNTWLDIEPAYRTHGWTVQYEAPSYGDDPFKPYFTFKVK